MARHFTGIQFASKEIRRLATLVGLEDPLGMEEVEEEGADVDEAELEAIRGDTSRCRRRVRIALIDHSFRTKHPLFSKGAVFGSKGSRLINEMRTDISKLTEEQKRASIKERSHGTFCSFVLASEHPSGHWQDAENEPDAHAEHEKVFDLADFADLVLIPLRSQAWDALERGERQKESLKYGLDRLKSLIPHAYSGIDYSDFLKKVREIEASPISGTALSKHDLIKYLIHSESMTSQPVVDAFEEALALAKRGILRPGDIVVAPLAIGFRTATGRDVKSTQSTFEAVHSAGTNGSPIPQEIDLPMVHSPMVEWAVRQLTRAYGISVVLAAGQSGIDLADIPGDLRVNLRNPTLYDEFGLPRPSLFPYSNMGLECGAILVGGSMKRKASHGVNYGRCVDAFSRFKISGEKPAKFDGLEPQEMSLLDGTSLASMVVAASLANLQQIRILSEGVTPLTPVDARAHIRQWRHMSPEKFTCQHEFTGRPPDLEAMLVGTGVIKAKPKETESDAV